MAGSSRMLGATVVGLLSFKLVVSNSSRPAVTKMHAVCAEHAMPCLVCCRSGQLCGVRGSASPLVAPWCLGGSRTARGAASTQTQVGDQGQRLLPCLP